jgi:hypothetical protein
MYMFDKCEQYLTTSKNNCMMYCHNFSFPMNDQIERNKCSYGG